jgi:nitroreductase
VDTLEAIQTLRSMRRYTDEPVSDEEIQTCLRAAVQAPNGGNLQPWRFLVVTDAQAKKGLAEIYRRAWRRYEPAVRASIPAPPSEDARARNERNLASAKHLADHLEETPALVLFALQPIDLTLRDAEGPMDIGTPYASIYPAVQNFMLAARALGIGTALTTVYRIYQDEVRELLGIPEALEIVALVPMGRPRGRFGVAPRRPAEAVTYWNRWGAKR